jgi:hypothetical protein
LNENKRATKKAATQLAKDSSSLTKPRSKPKTQETAIMATSIQSKTLRLSIHNLD